MYKAERVGAIIVAAGESRRMNGVDKLFAPLGGKPVIVRTVNVFQTSEFVDEIILVVAERNIDVVNKFVKDEGWSKVRAVLAGGARRQDSVAAGLKGIRDCPWVVIHDGARPLVSEDLICCGLAEAVETGAAVAAVPVKDTVKVAGDDRLVRSTPPRNSLWAVQTPQVFRFDIINEAYRQVETEVTDDASLVEQLGYKVKLYMGAYDIFPRYDTMVR